MKKNNKLLILIIIILVLILGFVIYTYYSDYKKAQENRAEKIISVHLESFPVGTVAKAGMEGEEKAVFKKGEEWMGISGDIKVNQTRTLSFKILNSEGKVIVENDKWEETIQKGQGNFGMCCIALPEEVGQYKIQLYLDDLPQQVLSFSVTE